MAGFGQFQRGCLVAVEPAQLHVFVAAQGRLALPAVDAEYMERARPVAAGIGPGDHHRGRADLGLDAEFLGQLPAQRRRRRFAGQQVPAEEVPHPG